MRSDVALVSIGSHALKGMDKPQPLYRVEGHAHTAAGLAQPLPQTLAELIGRQSELLLLQDRWAQAIEGAGQVLCLSGEAGIGKSRLLHALRAHAAGVASTCLATSGSAHHQSTAFFPVIELLRGLFRFERGDTASERLTKLSCALEEHGVTGARTRSVFAALLSLPIDAAPASAPAGSQRETLEALLALVLGLAARRPLLLVVEDLHWLDPSTLELLGMLIDQAPTANLFLVTAARPNFEPPWGARRHVNALRLGRLKRTEVERLVLQVTGNKPLPPEVLEQIALKTDGVPLFVEELTKTVLELGLLRDLGTRFELIGPLAPLAIPTTVHDSLMARLDRLSSAKSVAQLAAVLGRSFAFDLLQAVAELASGALQRALAQLVAAEVLLQRGSPPLANYSFKHALVQDAAYGSLLRSARQVFHQRIATVMAEQFADLAQAHPELLAHHCTEAGLAAQAIPHWQRAAQLSIERCANREAISQYGSALTLLATLPPSAERAQQELDILLGLGPALMATRGYAAPEVERTYERARELSGGVGQAAQRFTVLTGLWRYYLNRARLQTAREVAEQMLGLCDEASDSSLPAMAHYALGTTLYYQGELEAAAAQLDRTVALYNVRQNLSVTATDPRITSLCCSAWVLWLQGHADRALARSQQAIALARELSHLPSLTHALYYTAMLHQYRREPDAAQEHLRSLMACSTERGFAYWEARGTVLQGWIHCQQGQYAKGIAMLLQGIETTQAIGAELAQPNYLAMLAEAYLHSGDVAAGTRLVTQALERVQHTGERRWESELLRLRGELLIADGDTATHNAADLATRHAADPTSPEAPSAMAAMAAEAAFVQALAVARGQGARALELRAATSLHRLQRRRGNNGHSGHGGHSGHSGHSDGNNGHSSYNGHSGHIDHNGDDERITANANAGAAELEAICRSFTEGLQSADFLDAQALLAQR